MPTAVTVSPRPAPTPPWRDRSGFCAPHPLEPASGTLTPQQIAMLRELGGRVQLSHDLLAAFADRYVSFPALAPACTRELAMLRTLFARYGIADPAVGTDPDRQAQQACLRSEGFRSRADALRVTHRLALETIRLLDRELPALQAPDARHACLHVLLAAHRQARRALNWSGR